MGNRRANLVVSLHIGLDPEVRISEHKLDAAGRKIRWKRKKNETFKFKRLNELDQAYFNKQSIDLDRKKITCNNRAPAGKDFEYEIIVTLNGTDHTSTKSGSPPGGKPVIRN